MVSNKAHVAAIYSIFTDLFPRKSQPTPKLVLKVPLIAARPVLLLLIRPNIADNSEKGMPQLRNDAAGNGPAAADR
jgi:hypothetical protein